jgi:hypothetical protein
MPHFGGERETVKNLLDFEKSEKIDLSCKKTKKTRMQ